MRLRNIQGSREAILSSRFTVEASKEMQSKWKDVFSNNHPIHIEIGMGKGRFITSLAQENPDINYIGIEKYSSVLIRAIEKQKELELPNLCFVRMDAEIVAEVFGQDEVDKIYLNFSDPWPKDRHAKRRLTSRQFFKKYDQILKPDGKVEFKSDNRTLFDFSIEEVGEAGWLLEAYTYDLHQDQKMRIGNIMTEYEEKFSSLGTPINKLIAFRRKSV